MPERKLLFIAPSAYPLGGVAVWLDYLLPGLVAEKWVVTLGLVSGKYHNVESYRSTHPFPHAIAIQYSTGSRKGRVRALMNTFVREQPDIVVVVNIVDAYEAVRRLREQSERPFKLVTNLHALEQDLLSDIQVNREVIDAVVCTNRLTQAVVRERCGLSIERVLYAPYGVDVCDWISRTPSGNLTIGYSGRFEQEQKRVRDIPDIMEAINNKGIEWQLLLAGGGAEEEYLRSAFSRPEFAGKVEFLGFVSPEQMKAEFYDRCDALLITSSWETGPIVAWEAMVDGV